MRRRRQIAALRAQGVQQSFLIGLRQFLRHRRFRFVPDTEDKIDGMLHRKMQARRKRRPSFRAKHRGYMGMQGLKRNAVESSVGQQLRFHRHLDASRQMQILPQQHRCLLGIHAQSKRLPEVRLQRKCQCEDRHGPFRPLGLVF